MAVVVNQSETIDSALKRLLRESLREGILQTARAKMYHVRKKEKILEKNREWKKMKRRRRAQSRRINQKMGL